MSTEIEAPRWSAAEFAQYVLDQKPKVAVFDCDGTLWSGDSGSGFMYWSLEQGLVSSDVEKWMKEQYLEYNEGMVSELEICGDMVQIYEGLVEEELRQAAAEFAEEKIRRWIFPEMAALVESLQRIGTEIWAVSSTNKWVVNEGLRDFGIAPERVRAAEVLVAGGVLQRKLLAVPTGEAKAAALVAAKHPHPDAVFGNSVHDLAMLEMALAPYPVNPSHTLQAAAEERGWRCYFPEGTEGSKAHVGGEIHHISTTGDESKL